MVELARPLRINCPLPWASHVAGNGRLMVALPAGDSLESGQVKKNMAGFMKFFIHVEKAHCVLFHCETSRLDLGSFEIRLLV